MYEAKLNYIKKTDTGIDIKASIYRTSDPILETVGGQERTRYNRTLLFQDTRTVPLTTTKLQIVNFIKAKMNQRNTDDSLGFIPADLYVNFQNIGIQ